MRVSLSSPFYESGKGNPYLMHKNSLKCTFQVIYLTVKFF